MERRPIWKNEAARVRLEDWFIRFRSKIPGTVESRLIPTRHGFHPVMLAGRLDRPPLVCLHAMRTSSAHLVSELGPLLDRFRIIAPDIPSQSVKGLPFQLSLKDHSFAEWLIEVLDGLGLNTVNLFGVSFGGFVAWKTASYVPHRVRRLAMLVPAGIANGSHRQGFAKMALPLLRYRIWRSEKNLRRLLDPLMTTWDDDWGGYMRDSMKDMSMNFQIPRLATDSELRKLKMPVLVLGAANDLSFPGKAVVDRVKTIVPHAEGEVIENCKHCPPTTDEFRVWLADRLTRFLN